MKIYKVMWFDEDAYGPTRMLWFIVQAEDKNEALNIAKKSAQEDTRYNFTDEQLATYEKLEVENISVQTVLVSDSNSFGL